MEDMYTRTRMLIGDGVDALRSSRVAVFGCGGVGSYVAEALARAGVGAITVVDGDTVSVTNLNRQLIATVDTVGKPKAEAQRDRILSINPECRATALDLFYSEESADTIDLSSFDYVCDAIDTVTGKIHLVLACGERHIPIISSMGAGNKLDPTLFEVADIYKTSVDPIARVMRKKLKEHRVKKLKVVYSKERPLVVRQSGCGENCICPPGAANNCEKRRAVPGSISFVPSVVGLILAGEVVRDLVHAKVEVSA